jgi:ribonuclease P protein component
LVPLTITAETLSQSLQPVGVVADAAAEIRLSIMPAKKAARFPRSARLLRHADFQRVYKQGRRHFSATMTVFYWPRPETEAAAQNMADERPVASARKLHAQGLRVGFTVGRVLGDAVERNRMKRRLREAVRLTRPTPGVPADVVINPKKSLLSADFADVLSEVERAFTTIEQKLSGRTTGSRKPETAN